ncbi:MAG: hypothetical protein ACKV2T_19030 [Kofleriaceae bacterium]
MPMKLVFALPSAHAPNVRVFEPTHGDPRPWLGAILGDGPVTTRAMTTRRGWSMQLLHGAHGVVALYTMWDLTAAIGIAGASEVDDLTLEALRAAEPDWRSDEPLVVDELWSTPLGL